VTCMRGRGVTGALGGTTVGTTGHRALQAVVRRVT
jgi:hypothetical protein